MGCWLFFKDSNAKRSLCFPGMFIYFFCCYWYRRATCKWWKSKGTYAAVKQAHSKWTNITSMDQYCFHLTGRDWSQTDMRFQDENSRCLLWRRMSSNRAVHPLMKPTGRQRHRNQSLHSPTHLTWLDRLNWRAWDCECSSFCCCCCLGSMLHCSPAVLKGLTIEYFFWFCVSCRTTCPDQY